MTDVHDKATRSRNMSRIRSGDTKPEMLVRSYLHGRGLRYSLHNRKLPGKPDLVLSRHKTVIFVNGCFWHGHEGCRYFVIPKTRTAWWLQKIGRNKERDSEAEKKLNALGWKVIVVWECQLKKNERESTLTNIYKEVTE